MELVMVEQNQVTNNEIFGMTEDILNFLEEDLDDNYETNQHLVGMAELFCGHIIKAWYGVDFSQDKYCILNRIVTKHYILYYAKCWKDRNIYYHDEQKQKIRAIEWKRKLEKNIEENELVNVRRMIQQMNIDEQQCSANTILKWIYTAKKLIGKVKKLPANDIRN